MTPMVSVVMCTYNTEKYIAEAINSILNQSYRNFEFIIWDDGSTDGTKAVVASFCDSRIRYFYHENTGLGMALRLACAEAKGKYIARMDSDDISLPDRLSKEMYFLENHLEYVLVSSAVYNIDDGGNVLGRVFPCSDDRVLKRALACHSNMISHPMVMMRREAYENAGGYIPIRKSQDMLFWSRLAQYGKFYNIPSPLGKYRVLSTSLDHARNPYASVLKVFLEKMIQDKTLIKSDVELFNSLYQYSKPFIVKREAVDSYKKKQGEERLFSVLRWIMGCGLAERIIVELKNRYYLFKLHQ